MKSNPFSALENPQSSLKVLNKPALRQIEESSFNSENTNRVRNANIIQRMPVLAVPKNFSFDLQKTNF